MAALEHLLRAHLAGNYATVEHCGATELLPGTHYRRVRYGAGAILVAAEQTGTGFLPP